MNRWMRWMVAGCLAGWMAGGVWGAEAGPESGRPDEIRRGVTMGGTPEERMARARQQAVRRIEPSLKGSAERLGVYVSYYQREYVKDARLFAFRAEAAMEGDAVVLKGYAEHREHMDGLVRLLGDLGFASVRNEMEKLPAGEARFGIVVAPAHALIYDKAAAPRETMTDALPGECLWLLKREGDHYLCHASEGYVGYIASDAVKVVGPEEFTAALNAGTSDEGRIRRALDTAMGLRGTRYVWGGKTSDGIDCSGVVQAAYRSIGIYLPRDADQQCLVGKMVALRENRAALRPGDVLFFMGRRGNIHHTALYLGNDSYVEAAGGGVKVSSFVKTAENYDKGRDETFCFAKRVIEQSP